MKKYLGVIVFLLIFFMAPLSLFGGEKITLTTLDWEPYIGQNLKNQGYVAEIAVEAFKRSGYDVEIKFYPWARAKKLSDDGKVDGYFPEYYADELKQYSLISKPYPGGPLGFFKRAGSDIKFTSLEALKPYKIGVVRGYVNEAKFDAATFLKKEEAVDDLTNIKKLLKERLDLIVADKFVGFYLLKENMPHMMNQMEFISPPLENKDLYLCISKKTPDAEKKMKAFNDGLTLMEKDGTLTKILNRHGF